MYEWTRTISTPLSRLKTMNIYPWDTAIYEWWEEREITSIKFLPRVNNIILFSWDRIIKNPKSVRRWNIKFFPKHIRAMINTRRRVYDEQWEAPILEDRHRGWINRSRHIRPRDSSSRNKRMVRRKNYLWNVKRKYLW